MSWSLLTSIADIRYWIRSARSDARLERLRGDHDNAQSLDLLYEQRKDPWGLDSPGFRYQQRKYSKMMSLLPRRGYKRALDLGCGLGTLTRRLGGHVERVLGIDVSQVAIAQARREMRQPSNVEFQQGDALNLGQELDGKFDLVVIADTLYYLSPISDEVLRTACQRVAQVLAPEGTLLLVNHFTVNLDPGSRWTRRIHDVFRSAPEFKTVHESRHAFFLASIFEKCA